MQIAANKIDFLTNQSSRLGFADFEIPVRAGKLFQHIIANRLSGISNSRSLFTQLTQYIIQFAEHAYCVRDWNSLEQASAILMNLPLAGTKQISAYYQAIAGNRRGRKDEALTQFETILDEAPFVYRARSTQALGMMRRERGDLDEALRFNLEALRMASDGQGKNLLTLLMASWEIAIIKSVKGDHQRALEDFEKLFPVIRFASKQYPFYFYLHHNALAVEFSELGRITEAENAINIALSSPFVSLIQNGLRHAKKLNRSVTILILRAASLIALLLNQKHLRIQTLLYQSKLKGRRKRRPCRSIRARSRLDLFEHSPFIASSNPLLVK